MQTDRFRSTVSNKWWETFDPNNAINTLGETARSIWGKPVEHTTIIQAPEEKEKNNTMLYVGIGGGALLLVVLLIVFLR